MPREIHLVGLLAMFLWGVWYFSKMLWTGFRKGVLIDSTPMDGVAVTRTGKPIAFWFSMVLGVVFTIGFSISVIVILGDFLGFWRSEF